MANNLGLALQGLGAGIQGRGAEFNAQLMAQRESDEARAEKQKQERLKTFYMDSMTALNFIANKQPDQAAKIFFERSELLHQVPGADPIDSDTMAQLFMMAQSGDQEAAQRIVDTLGGIVNTGVAGGYIELPKAEKKTYQQATGKGMEGWSFDASTGQFSLDPNYQKYLESDAGRLAGKDLLSAKDVSGINDKVTALVKDPVQIRAAASDLEALSANASQPDVIAAIFKFMKALDPTSAVRENEVGMIEGAEGAAQGLANMYNRLMGEGGMSREGFLSIVNTAKTLANSSILSAEDSVNKYTEVMADNLTGKQLKNLRARLPSQFIIPDTPSMGNIPPDLPAGTKSNKDGTFTLPTGEVIRPKPRG